MQNEWQDAFKDLLEGFCTGFKGKHPNRDFLWRRSLKTWKINTLHLQKCGHFCLKGLKCQECRQPSSRGCSDFTHLLFQLWALSKERKAQGGAAPISAVSRSALGELTVLGSPGDPRCEWGTQNDEFLCFVEHTICWMATDHCQLPFQLSHQAEGMWNVLWLGEQHYL